MEKLTPNQQAIFETISEYSKFPIDCEHLMVKTRNGRTCLEFYYEASSEIEFNVFAEFFEDAFTLCCEGWHDEFFMDESPEQSAKRALEMLKSIFEGKVRVRVEFAGKSPYQWIIVSDEGIDWGVMRLTGLFFYNYFGKRKTIEKVNRLIV